MSELMAVILVIQLILLIKFMRDDAVQMYKIGYYEEKLKNRGVDISHVENITLKEILTWK